MQCLRSARHVRRRVPALACVGTCFSEIDGFVVSGHPLEDHAQGTDEQSRQRVRVLLSSVSRYTSSPYSLVRIFALEGCHHHAAAPPSSAQASVSRVAGLVAPCRFESLGYDRDRSPEFCVVHYRYHQWRRHHSRYVRVQSTYSEICSHWAHRRRCAPRRNPS